MNLIKIIFVLLIVISINFAQEKKRISPVYIEHNSIVTDSQQTEILSYRIPYSNLIFIRDANKYNASFTISFEFIKDDKVAHREIIADNIITQNYSETTKHIKYYQNFISVKLDTGNYDLVTILSLENTDLEFQLPKKMIEVKNINNENILGPFIVHEVNDQNKFILSNFSNTIPYSPNYSAAIFGIKKAYSDTLIVNIKQEGRDIFSASLTPISFDKINFKKNREDIEIYFSDKSPYKYYLLKNFSHKLYEGQCKLSLKVDSLEIEKQIMVVWHNKPKVLSNTEYAIKLLEYIEDEQIVVNLLSGSKSDYYKNLVEYWVEKYPADGMKYNYAMEEFYRRVDYAIENYSSLNSFDGAERDRGQIYILYGTPSSIERNYTEINEIIEVWEYDNLGLRFVFKDTNGTGKFDLVE